MLRLASMDLNVCHWGWLNHIRRFFSDEQKEGIRLVDYVEGVNKRFKRIVKIRPVAGLPELLWRRLPC
jgi:hypothetical protein